VFFLYSGVPYYFSDKLNLMPLFLLHSDELTTFEESWQRNAGNNFPGWDPRMNMLGNGTALPPISLLLMQSQTFFFIVS
jgi:hypothetical protein